MNLNTILLIVALEALAVCIFVVLLLLAKNRKLRRLLKALQEKVRSLVAQAKNAVAPPPPRVTYGDFLSEQIEGTRDYHHDQGVEQDIALDIDPNAPTPRRTAALRHAWLIAEKAAAGNPEEPVKWDFLAERYQQLLKFNERYGKEEEEPDHHFAFNQTKEALAQARARIVELEAIETRYYELEQQWSQCRGRADEQLQELQNLTDSSDQDATSINTVLEQYSAAYSEIDALLNTPFPDLAQTAEAAPESQHSEELERLRSVAAEQHRIISELKARLEQTTDADEQVSLISELQQELKKQERFMLESESCIQQMEEELKHAHEELSRFRADRKAAPALRSELEQLHSRADKQELTISGLKTENHRLKKALEAGTTDAPFQHDDEALAKAQADLFEMQAQYNELREKYNDLEEKFLNLKLQDD